MTHLPFPVPSLTLLYPYPHPHPHPYRSLPYHTYISLRALHVPLALPLPLLPPLPLALPFLYLTSTYKTYHCTAWYGMAWHGMHTVAYLHLRTCTYIYTCMFTGKDAQPDIVCIRVYKSISLHMYIIGYVYTGVCVERQRERERARGIYIYIYRERERMRDG